MIAMEDEISKLTHHSTMSSSSTSTTTSTSTPPPPPYDTIDIQMTFKLLMSDMLRLAVQKTGYRVDGRNITEIRPISIETRVLPGAHGSSLFTR
jgi:polyribonucleotide nucleotidyltransferase